MPLSSLILSRDDRTIRLLKLMLADFSIESEAISDAAHARELLGSRKFDGFFAECETEEGASLLRSVKKSKHNKRSIIFALSSTEVKMSVAFDLGAHFVIQTPIAIEKVKRTLKAAHGLMMREQRVHYRHPAATLVTVKSSPNTVWQGTLRDLSQSGASIETKTVLKKGQPLELRFLLPETSIAIEATGQVSWADPTGRAGVRFDTISEHSQRDLLDWVLRHSMEAESTELELIEAVAHVPADKAEAAEPDWGFELIEPTEEVRPVRAVLRAEHRGSVKVLAFQTSSPLVAQGNCVNLSAIGMGIELEEEVEISGAVLVRVSLQEDQSITLHANIRHQEGARYGLEFVALSTTDRDLLQANLADLPVE
jgi:c-di-GMP-binding flagellar brake protein YcgR